MKDQFLVCKQARGHMSSETQGKVLEDEYMHGPGKLLAGKVYNNNNNNNNNISFICMTIIT